MENGSVISCFNRLYAIYIIGLRPVILKPQIIFSGNASDAVASSFYIFNGKITSGSSLTLNGNTVSTDKNGNFSVQVNLNSGQNNFLFTAVNSFGKEQTIVKTILERYN